MGAGTSWPALSPGQDIEVVKVRPDGSEATRYPATVLPGGCLDRWIAVEAHWTLDLIDLDGLRFTPGDTLHEFFTDSEYFNAFSVFAPDGTLRGWYANVTYPSWITQEEGDPPVLYWHDLFIDLIGLPSGEFVVRDEDELEAAQPSLADPALHETILIARDEMVERFRKREFPFHERDAAGAESAAQR
jgi:protein associated with RNAse G/E